ncbi:MULTISPECIES: GNAT family N-acetyltransferase [unclassified Arsukibacterium]|uniref:GNAT family N-acetyltransferase n=2 Tax=Arsukibacterium TaxID=336830 RepID=UPI000C3C5A54|nr:MULTISPECIES: GNAT family N-acetyltransferase [unclassified Arsukibacterium]MAA93157.1 GNAT family N-acetyltransferase [Rheinheimera sp.]MBM33717.1 GNAT family N-acetyltransferase [Rheinheimera sp.]HAW91437.1 GNAT family N-acetyltransferase [Candidatus Azambacteria bacterium]
MSDKLITTWYLHYQGPTLPMPHLPADCLLMEATVPSPELSQFLFTAVGNHWHWFSRLSWDYQQWLDYLNKDSVRTWVLYQAGTIAGFVELNYHPVTVHLEKGPSVELKFFGLLPAFTGKGLGPKLAQAAVALAQQWLSRSMPNTANKMPVWVHTCSADHPAALATYQKAGFAIYHTTQEPADIPGDYAEAILCRNYLHSRLSHFAAI